MENFFVRYKNPLALMAVVIIQVVALATQVKRPETAKASGGSTPLIRVWTVTAFTPVEKMFINTGHFFRNGWHNYADLRSVRRQNHDLQEKVASLQMEQVQLKQDADQARRLQALLEFKERYVSRTVPAQVIATSGTEQSRLITIDKGSHDGLRQDMAVITPDGIVGKIKDVFPLSSQVLLINDHDSGAGVILERSRLQGIVKGTSLGELQIEGIMSDEQIEAGDHVITSGGDRIYPKGFSVGTVVSAVPDKENDPFLAIRIKPAADLRRLEEVLVVTKLAEETAPAVASGSSPMRAADILAQRLPSIPKVDPNAPKTPGGTPAAAKTGAPAATASPSPAKTNQPAGTGAAQKTGNVTPSAKPPATGTATPTPTPAATRKTGTETKPSSAGQPAANGSATPTPTPAKPKAAPKKPKPPTATPDGTSPGTTEPKASQPGTEAPATPTPTPENPQL